MFLGVLAATSQWTFFAFVNIIILDSGHLVSWQRTQPLGPKNEKVGHPSECSCFDVLKTLRGGYGVTEKPSHASSWGIQMSWREKGILTAENNVQPNTFFPAVDFVWTPKQNLTHWYIEFPLRPMGFLAPRSAHDRPSGRPPSDVSETISAHVSAMSPTNCNPQIFLTPGNCWPPENCSPPKPKHEIKFR